jgi:hypothetical protein
MGPKIAAGVVTTEELVRDVPVNLLLRPHKRNPKKKPSSPQEILHVWGPMKWRNVLHRLQDVPLQPVELLQRYFHERKAGFDVIADVVRRATSLPQYG